MKQALSDKRLKEIALGRWPSSKEDEFERVWDRTLLPVMREQEQRSSAISQRVYSKPSSDGFHNPDAGAETPWWESDARIVKSLMQSHIDSLKDFARSLYSKHGAEPCQRRTAAEKAKKDAGEKRESDRIAKLKDEFRSGALQRFRAAGGTIEQFDECFDTLWLEHLQKKAVEPSERPMPHYLRTL